MTGSNTDPLDARALDRRRFLSLAARAGALALVPAFLPRASAGADSALLARSAGGGSAGAGAASLEAAGETARAWRAMGTLLEVRVPDLPRAEAVEAIRAVRRRVEELEAALTLYRPESPLVAFNRAPEGRWVDAPPHLADAVAAAADAAAASRGAYDPTVAPLMRAWGLVHLDGRVPSRAQRRAWRNRPGFEAVEIDRGGRRLRRLHAGAEIDLGGIGKGIAVDAALDALARAGSRTALVNFGGGIGALGAPAPEGWAVAVVHPRRPGALWSVHRLRSGHLATSGDYERWVQTPAGRTHHLLDPRTGEPARGVASATVWAPRGVAADVRSTSAFIERARGVRSGDPALVLLEEDGVLREERDGGFGTTLG